MGGTFVSKPREELKRVEGFADFSSKKTLAWPATPIAKFCGLILCLRQRLDFVVFGQELSDFVYLLLRLF